MANGSPTPRRRALAVGLGFAAASGTRNAGLPIRAEGMVSGRAVREAERGGMEFTGSGCRRCGGWTGYYSNKDKESARPVFSIDDQTGVVVWCGVLSGSMADGTATRC